MLSEQERRRCAEDLLRAERERKAIPQLSRTFPDMELEDAYRVQDLWAEGRIAQGARMVGHKIGLTSRAMQMASKMTEPDYGRILDDALYNDGARIRADSFLKPRLEVELAFIMGEDLPLGRAPFTLFRLGMKGMPDAIFGLRVFSRGNKHGNGKARNGAHH